MQGATEEVGAENADLQDKSHAELVEIIDSLRWEIGRG